MPLPSPRPGPGPENPLRHLCPLLRAFAGALWGSLPLFLDLTEFCSFREHFSPDFYLSQPIRQSQGSPA